MNYTDFSNAELGRQAKLIREAGRIGDREKYDSLIDELAIRAIAGQKAAAKALGELGESKAVKQILKGVAN